jgi:oxaloacetate decarboxylase alpha subunit
MNVLMGERYKVSSAQTKDLVSGHYGRTTLPIKEEVRKKIIGDQEPITCRPADLIEPQLPQFEKEVAFWKQQDEDVLSYALFPQVAMDFFKYRLAQQSGVDLAKADQKNGAYPA